MVAEPMSPGGTPRISIIVPAFNSSAYVEAAIRSLLAQTRTDWEAIVVDDGSTDDTAAIAECVASADSRVRIVGQKNLGTATARNSGAAIAQAQWLVFLDADDLLMPDYIERQVSFMESHPNFDIYSSNAMLERPDGMRREFWTDTRSASVHSLRSEDQIHESSILIMSLVRRSVFELIGGFRTSHSEDYDFWLRALLSGATHIYNPDVLAVYRRHEGQRTRSLVDEAKSFLRILEDAAKRPGLTVSEAAALEDSIRFARARVRRRQLEESLLEGRYGNARASYWGSRRAFPDKGKFLFGLLVICVSPRLYASIKSRRMV